MNVIENDVYDEEVGAAGLSLRSLGFISCVKPQVNVNYFYYCIIFFAIDKNCYFY